jgi:hypothetical protein
MFDLQIPFPINLIAPCYRWARNKVIPTPKFLTGTRKSQWLSRPDSCQWQISFTLQKGLSWTKRIERCRLYLIRRDFGPLDSEPEGIWLKWVVDGEPVDPMAITMEVGRSYGTIVVVRDWREGTAYIANEAFIESKGTQKKWPLPPTRDSKFIDENKGRYTFWLEIRSGRKRWRSPHFYAAVIPAAGEHNDRVRLGAVGATN